MLRIFKYVGFGAVLLTLSIACVKDVDADQLKEVELSPVYEIDFIFSQIQIPDLTGDVPVPPQGIPVVEVRDTLDYDFLGEEFVTENLDSVALTFEFRNTIQRDADFSFEFLNEASMQVGRSFQIEVAQGDGENSAPVLTTETILLTRADITAIANATQLATTFRMTQVDTTLTGLLILRSKGTYYFNYPL